MDFEKRGLMKLDLRTDDLVSSLELLKRSSVSGQNSKS